MDLLSRILNFFILRDFFQKSSGATLIVQLDFILHIQHPIPIITILVT